MVRCGTADQGWARWHNTGEMFPSTGLCENAGRVKAFPFTPPADVKIHWEPCVHQWVVLRLLVRRL